MSGWIRIASVAGKLARRFFPPIGARLPLLAAVCVPVLAVSADLEIAYRDARDNDPVLAAVEAGYAAQRQAIPQARSGLLPRMSLAGNTSQNRRSFPIPPVLDTNPGSPTFGQMVEIPAQSYNEHGWQAQLNQPVFRLAAWYDLMRARAVVDSARSGLGAAEQALVLRVTQAYLDVLRAQDRLDAATAQERAVQRQLDQVQQRFNVGLVAITDVLEARAAYDSASVARIQAEGDLHVFFNALETLTGVAYAGVDRVAENLPIVDPEPQDEASWVQAALASNFNVASAQASVKAARRNLAARRADLLPTIDGSATYSHFVTGGLSFLGNKINTTSYALTMTVPIYQGGFNHARAAEARALVEQARQELLNQQLTATRDARSLYRRVLTEVARVGARRKAIASSQSALEATETGYEVGTRNIVDVLLAQQRLFAAQFDYADSRYNYVIALMLLKQTAGSLEIADLIDLNRYTDPADSVSRSGS